MTAAVGLPMDLAPRDGTMLRLLVQFENTSFEDSNDPCWTIGFNNLSNTEEDRWQFAGWSWVHDCILEGDGKPLAWLPMLDNSIPDPDPVMCACGAVTERECSETPIRRPGCRAEEDSSYD